MALRRGERVRRGRFRRNREIAPVPVQDKQIEGKQKRRPKAAFCFSLAKVLQRRFNLKAPSLEQRFGDIF
jgi:hypothetical protein